MLKIQRRVVAIVLNHATLCWVIPDREKRPSDRMDACKLNKPHVEIVYMLIDLGRSDWTATKKRDQVTPSQIHGRKMGKKGGHIMCPITQTA